MSVIGLLDDQGLINLHVNEFLSVTLIVPSRLDLYFFLKNDFKNCNLCYILIFQSGHQSISIDQAIL